MFDAGTLDDTKQVDGFLKAAFREGPGSPSETPTEVGMHRRVNAGDDAEEGHRDYERHPECGSTGDFGNGSKKEDQNERDSESKSCRRGDGQAVRVEAPPEFG